MAGLYPTCNAVWDFITIRRSVIIDKVRLYLCNHTVLTHLYSEKQRSDAVVAVSCPFGSIADSVFHCRDVVIDFAVFLFIATEFIVSAQGIKHIYAVFFKRFKLTDRRHES